MNTATAARVAAGVTSAYVRDLSRHPSPTAGDARRAEPTYRRDRGHPSALDASGRRRGRPGRDPSWRGDVPKRVSKRAQVRSTKSDSAVLGLAQPC
jgi:hypothetical protein